MNPYQHFTVYQTEKAELEAKMKQYRMVRAIREEKRAQRRRWVLFGWLSWMTALLRSS